MGFVMGFFHNRFTVVGPPLCLLYCSPLYATNKNINHLILLHVTKTPKLQIGIV